MPGATVGFFGKLPSHGDFIERRLAPAFREVWDDWLQRCIAASRAALDDRWLDVYLTSPVWRFFLSDGIAGGASFGGILVPSVDRVGRYFPLTVVAEMPAGLSAMHFAQAGEHWLREAEALVLDALQLHDFDLQAFDLAVAETGVRLEDVRPVPTMAFPAGGTHWRWPIGSAGALAQGLAPLLLGPAERALRPLSLWWTDGSDLIRPSALLVRSLPEPQSFSAMLSGSWEQSGWVADRGAEDSAPQAAPFAHHVCSAAVTDSGPVRLTNQDNFAANDQSRLWAVADGMGGHSGGEIASQMVVDALNALEPAPTLNAMLESVHVALERVNSDLRRPGIGRVSTGPCGSTVVVLAMRGAQWAAAWAGDTRAYLLREGRLLQLTHDHSPQNDPAVAGAVAQVVAAQASGIVTRAVGGEDVLRLDQVSDALRIGDRFLLCSDGLYNALEVDVMSRSLAAGSVEEAAQMLVAKANAAGARDNVTAVVIDVLAGE